MRSKDETFIPYPYRKKVDNTPENENRNFLFCRCVMFPSGKPNILQNFMYSLGEIMDLRDSNPTQLSLCCVVPNSEEGFISRASHTCSMLRVLKGFCCNLRCGKC
jgi:hypothetical protein